MGRTIRSRLVEGKPLREYFGPSTRCVFHEAGARRARRLICHGCLHGKHDKCESEACPCVCNDSDFRFTRKPKTPVANLTRDPELANVLVVRPELRSLFN